ncbi:polysaccharide deacetylase family protein [Kitasatospora sp. MAP5-34]|uniref:polysaccharide deacetylase family protein n=1 Tax=Kitasatospora sp. MAP5-34 TaxID=3035102 RepID=UPI002476ADAA|nr:polysaccharide deacetylase family protein [Kitasatospora sp. MAP5-34]MDH6577907.1 peptidoglycan/xylan/chitin deacetylase (PgdA/CDA1 family) [Kitasatospora sp. MAP5-34]
MPFLRVTPRAVTSQTVTSQTVTSRSITSRAVTPRARLRLAAWTCLTLTAAGCTAPATAPTPTPPAASAPRAAHAPPAQPSPPDRTAEQEDNGPRSAARQALAIRQAAETARRWGLDAVPEPPPAPPADKPELTAQPGVSVHGDLPPLVFRVPTSDQVVFLTVDDGAEKDAEFSRMTRELGIPFTAFVSGYLARSDYGYFRELRDQGVRVNNHTLNHPDLRRLGYPEQRREICGQQDELERELGARPVLFRPPYGEFTEATLRAARSCGITALPIWNEEAFPDHLEYRYADQRLHPGDIILTHFLGPEQWKGGTMCDMLRRVLRAVADQGLTLARLDDYL